MPASIKGMRELELTAKHSANDPSNQLQSYILYYKAKCKCVCSSERLTNLFTPNFLRLLHITSL